MATAAEVISQHVTLAQRWRNPGLQLSRYITAFATDVFQRRGAHAASAMFWPMTSAAVPEPWIRTVGFGLYLARTYQVMPEMCNVITAMYHKASENVTKLSYEELPSDDGFVWLDEPLMLFDRQGKMTGTRAFSWQLESIPFGKKREEFQGIRLVSWADTRVADSYTSAWAAGILRRSEAEIGRLQYQHSNLVPFDVECRGRRDPEGVSPLAGNEVAWFHALLMLMGTKVASTAPAHLPKSVAKDAGRAVRRPEVSVITLRRITTHRERAEGTGSGPVDWSCQWLVQGHHRHMERYGIAQHDAVPSSKNRRVCAKCGAVLRWIEPYIKGPDGKPFRESPTLYRLSR